jgi:hypothetical protein
MIGEKFKAKHPKLAELIETKAPQVGNIIGDLLPDKGVLGIVKNIISSDPAIPEADKAEMLALANQAEELHLKEESLANEDRKRASDREIAIATSDKAPLINKIVQPMLALIVVLGTFFMWGKMIFGHYEPKVNEAIIIGVLSGQSAQILQYYFGSSSGSKEKSTQMEKMINK